MAAKAKTRKRREQSAAPANDEGRWVIVRSRYEEFQAAPSLASQVLLGWCLARLKRDHQSQGGGRGGDRKSTAHSTPSIRWPDLVASKAGIPSRTADRLIRLREAVTTKITRRRRADPAALMDAWEAAQGDPFNPGPRFLEVIERYCRHENGASLERKLRM